MGIEECANCGEPIVRVTRWEGHPGYYHTWYHLTPETSKVGVFNRRYMSELRRECTPPREKMASPKRPTPAFIHADASGSPGDGDE